MSPKTEAVPCVLVPGFHGYVEEPATDAAKAGERSAADELVDEWLRLLGGQGKTVRFRVELPGEASLTGQLPAEPAIESLAAALGDAGSPPLCFVYDWRLDLTAAATRLSAELEEHAAQTGAERFDLVGVGPGALVVRYLVESGALPRGAALVRRVALIAGPNRGVPAGLLLLNRLLLTSGARSPQAMLREVLAGFPAALQLIPPRGTAYLYLAGQPGVAIEPYAWPEAFLEGGGADDRPPTELAAEAIALNECLYGTFKEAFDPSWRRTVAFASAGVATLHELHVDLLEGQVHWTGVEPTPGSGDGVVPITSALPHPSTRCFVLTGPHLELPRDAALHSRLKAFLRGPLA